MVRTCFFSIKGKSPVEVGPECWRGRTDRNAFPSLLFLSRRWRKDRLIFRSLQCPSSRSSLSLLIDSRIRRERDKYGKGSSVGPLHWVEILTCGLYLVRALGKIASGRGVRLSRVSDGVTPRSACTWAWFWEAARSGDPCPESLFAGISFPFLRRWFC